MKIYSVYVSTVENNCAFCTYNIKTKENLIYTSADKDEAISIAKSAVKGVENYEGRGHVIYTVTDGFDDGVNNTYSHHTAFVVESELGKKSRIKISEYSHYYSE